MTNDDVKTWRLFTDEASNIHGACLGIFLKSPQEDTAAYSMRCEFKASNNEAEYEALVMGLEAAKELKIKKLHVSCDSLLIVNQVNGSYEAKDTKMIAYFSIVKINKAISKASLYNR